VSLLSRQNFRPAYPPNPLAPFTVNPFRMNPFTALSKDYKNATPLMVMRIGDMFMGDVFAPSPQWGRGRVEDPILRLAQDGERSRTTIGGR
jgi:hypothetical protein